MPVDVNGWVSGGVASFVVAVGLIIKYFLDWLGKRGENKRLTTEALANGPEWLVQQLRSSLTEEREEVQRLSGRIEELETQNAMLYERMRDQRREYEREVADLRSQMAEMAERLEALQRRLSVDPPA